MRQDCICQGERKKDVAITKMLDDESLDESFSCMNRKA